MSVTFIASFKFLVRELSFSDTASGDLSINLLNFTRDFVPYHCSCLESTFLGRVIEETCRNRQSEDQQSQKERGPSAELRSFICFRLFFDRFFNRRLFPWVQPSRKCMALPSQRTSKARKKGPVAGVDTRWRHRNTIPKHNRYSLQRKSVYAKHSEDTGRIQTAISHRRVGRSARKAPQETANQHTQVPTFWFLYFGNCRKDKIINASHFLLTLLFPPFFLPLSLYVSYG